MLEEGRGRGEEGEERKKGWEKKSKWEKKASSIPYTLFS